MEQNGNSLKGILVLNEKAGRILATEKSTEYVICSAVKFQVTSDICQCRGVTRQNIYIQVSKSLRTDSLNYTILFSSKLLNVTSTITIDDHQPMLVSIKELRGKSVGSLDIDVRLDIFRGTKPFTSLYNDTGLTDFELHGEDGSVCVHKVILANHSPVLKTMLSGKWKEVTAGAIEVPRISKETLQHLKDYMYLHKMPEDKVEQLAELASYYMMSDLKQRCTFVMLSHLKPENALQFLELAVKLNMKKLLIAILDNIGRGVIKVEDIDHWCALEEMEEQMDNDQVFSLLNLFKEKP